MKWMLDLNVVLDILQRRDPFYPASAEVLSKIVKGEASGHLPSHAVTTIHDIVHRHANKQGADDAVDWVLSNLIIVPQDRASFQQARGLSFVDFEDAAVASAAASVGCDQIVTRNVADFSHSPVPALTPEELLAALLSET